MKVRIWKFLFSFYYCWRTTCKNVTETEEELLHRHVQIKRSKCGLQVSGSVCERCKQSENVANRQLGNRNNSTREFHKNASLTRNGISTHQFPTRRVAMPWKTTERFRSKRCETLCCTNVADVRPRSWLTHHWTGDRNRYRCDNRENNRRATTWQIAVGWERGKTWSYYLLTRPNSFVIFKCSFVVLLFSSGLILMSPNSR